MLVKKKDRSYTTDKKYVRGKGFLDSASSALRNVGSYMYQNKDLWAKPMIGAAGISAFPMSARVVQKLATKEDPQNFILMYSVSANVSGQIASVIAGGLILGLLS